METQCNHRQSSCRIRIGLGHDTHRIAPEGPLHLGGVKLDVDFHLLGHSDADVLLHAITDAILGAANQGDIGELFPDTAEENRGLDSAVMLAAAKDRISGCGWRIVNLDCVVLAERPKLLPHKLRIRQRIADILQLDIDQVGLKGKTGEQTGDVGQGKVIQAICTCLLERA